MTQAAKCPYGMRRLLLTELVGSQDLEKKLDNLIAYLLCLLLFRTERRNAASYNPG